MAIAPKLSIVIPIHNMNDGAFFLWRNIKALMRQSFQDFEIVITEAGEMAENTNAGVKKARGEIIKIIYLDDYLAHPDALKVIVENFTADTKWLVTGCLHQQKGEAPKNPHYPEWNDQMAHGANAIGSPSVLAFRRENALYFDETLTWLLDCDLYRRFYDLHGPPVFLNDLNVVLGIGSHQMTNIITDERKTEEHSYLMKKYV